jgi:hypothetical protein
MGGRTLIIYMKRRGVSCARRYFALLTIFQMDSVFRVLEPVVERITERARQPGGFGRFTFGSTRSEWFRIYRVSYDHF